MFIKSLKFVKTHEDVSKDEMLARRTHGYSINLIIKLTFKNKVSAWCSEKESSFLVMFIYCCVNGFLKWNTSKETSYIVGKKNFFGKICIFNLRNKRKSIFAIVIIRKERWEKITKETGKIMIKSTYRRNNPTRFRKLITRGELVHFRSSIDTSRSRTRRIQFIIFNFIKKIFLFQLR